MFAAAAVTLTASSSATLAADLAAEAIETAFEAACHLNRASAEFLLGFSDPVDGSLKLGLPARAIERLDHRMRDEQVEECPALRIIVVEKVEENMLEMVASAIQNGGEVFGDRRGDQAKNQIDKDQPDRGFEDKRPEHVQDSDRIFAGNGRDGRTACLSGPARDLSPRRSLRA